MTPIERDRNLTIDAILTHIRGRVRTLTADERYEVLRLLADRLCELNDDTLDNLPAVNMEGTRNDA
jgi:hypothetical protein